MLFVDYSSAFNTVIPYKLVQKLSNLGFGSSLCSWILDFLSNRPQSVRMGEHTSSTLILNTGTPQGCVLSPILYSPFTHDCSTIHSTNTIVKFADDTTLIGLISDCDETAYREEVQHLTEWCCHNNLDLNITKTKELIVDFRKSKRVEHSALHIYGKEVERVESFKFLGVHISADLTWTVHISHQVGKAQQRLYFLRKLKHALLPHHLLINFYRTTIESLLTYCCAVWFASCTEQNRKDLQRVVRAAERVIGTTLPPLRDIYTGRLQKKATCISKDPTHPGHHLFSPLPSGKRYRALRTKTKRLLNSFFPQAVKCITPPSLLLPLPKTAAVKCITLPGLAVVQ